MKKKRNTSRKNKTFFEINEDMKQILLMLKVQVLFKLLNAVLQFQTPSPNLLLFGDISLSLEINKTIFENVYRFIMKTKRF